MSDEDKTEDNKSSDEVTMSKAEADRLKREAAEGQKKTRKLEAEVADLKAKADDAEAGSDEVAKLTKQLEREKARADKAEGRVGELEGEIENGKRETTVTAVAKRLGFRNPEVASKLIGDDDKADESSAEKALKGLLKSEPYLKDPGKGQRDVTGTESDDKSETGGSDKTETTGKTGQSRIADAYAKSGDNNKE